MEEMSSIDPYPFVNNSHKVLHFKIYNDQWNKVFMQIT